MKLFTLLMLISFNALACWKVEGSFAIDGQAWKLDQKVDPGKEYIHPMGPFILKFTITKSKSKEHEIKYVVLEKAKTILTLITLGEDEVSEGRENQLFLKGQEGKPNSILILKLINI